MTICDCLMAVAANNKLSFTAISRQFHQANHVSLIWYLKGGKNNCGFYACLSQTQAAQEDHLPRTRLPADSNACNNQPIHKFTRSLRLLCDTSVKYPVQSQSVLELLSVIVQSAQGLFIFSGVQESGQCWSCSWVWELGGSSLPVVHVRDQYWLLPSLA